MDLEISDVADLLSVNEGTIRRWITEGNIPSYKINDQHRFSRTEIENWVISRKVESPEAKKEKTGGVKQFGLYRAIFKGDVLHHIPGTTKEEVIHSTMKQVAKDLMLDAEVMTELLLDREKLMPTALNNGIAVPHTRDFLLNAHHDVVVVVFLDEPLPYGALDGKPVHTMFFLFACEDKRHLHLLAKIAHLSYQQQSLEFLQSKPSKEAMLTYIKNWETHIPSNE